VTSTGQELELAFGKSGQRQYGTILFIVGAILMIPGSRVFWVAGAVNSTNDVSALVVAILFFIGSFSAFYYREGCRLDSKDGVANYWTRPAFLCKKSPASLSGAEFIEIKKRVESSGREHGGISVHFDLWCQGNLLLSYQDESLARREAKRAAQYLTLGVKDRSGDPERFRSYAELSEPLQNSLKNKGKGLEPPSSTTPSRVLERTLNGWEIVIPRQGVSGAVEGLGLVAIIPGLIASPYIWTFIGGLNEPYSTRLFGVLSLVIFILSLGLLDNALKVFRVRRVTVDQQHVRFRANGLFKGKKASMPLSAVDDIVLADSLTKVRSEGDEIGVRFSNDSDANWFKEALEYIVVSQA
jgi:hypothetical protein